ELASTREGQDIVQDQTVGRSVDQPGAWHERGGLGETGRVPEGADLSLGLVAGDGATVEAVRRGRVEEERAEIVDGHVPVTLAKAARPHHPFHRAGRFFTNA